VPGGPAHPATVATGPLVSDELSDHGRGRQRTNTHVAAPFPQFKPAPTAAHPLLIVRSGRRGHMMRVPVGHAPHELPDRRLVMASVAEIRGGDATMKRFLRRVMTAKYRPSREGMLRPRHHQRLIQLRLGSRSPSVPIPRSGRWRTDNRTSAGSMEDPMSSTGTRTCSNCGQQGHDSRTCPVRGNAGKCSRCGYRGHDARNCSR
jgi:hypothetical protein